MKRTLALAVGGFFLTVLIWYAGRSVDQTARDEPGIVGPDLSEIMNVYLPRSGCPVNWALKSPIFLVHGRSDFHPVITGTFGDAPEKLSTIHIEYGGSPVTLIVASSQEMLWQLTGDTSRIDRLIVQQAFEGRYGVAGLPAEKIRFVENGECFRGKKRFLADRERHSDSDGVSWRDRTTLIDSPNLAFVSIPPRENRSPEPSGKRAAEYIDYSDIVFPEPSDPQQRWRIGR